MPIDRSGGSASQAAIDTGGGSSTQGELLGIYPEGTRSPDGQLYRGKTGVARMALEAGVVVLPVAMIDTDKIQPPGKVFPKIMRVGIKIGEPLDFSRYAGMEGDRFVLRSITDEIMYELMTLSGQEYVDMYATKAKTEIARRSPSRDGRDPGRRARRARPRRLTVVCAVSRRRPPTPSTARRPIATAGARSRRVDPARTGAAGARSWPARPWTTTRRCRARRGTPRRARWSR